MNPQDIKAKRIDTDPNTVRVLIAGRASYFCGLEATLDDSDNPQSKKSFKSAVLIPKDAPKAALGILSLAVKDAIEIGIKKKWKGSKPPKLDLPIRDGNIKAQENADKYAAYENNFHFTAKRQEEKGRPVLKAYGKIVEAQGVIESGDWCVWDVNFYPYSNKKNGVAVALNGVTLIMEGERFAGGPSEDSITNEANDLYGEMLSKGLSDSVADDLLGDLMGGSGAGKADEDPLMAMLG